MTEGNAATPPDDAPDPTPLSWLADEVPGFTPGFQFITPEPRNVDLSALWEGVRAPENDALEPDAASRSEWWEATARKIGEAGE